MFVFALHVKIRIVSVVFFNWIKKILLMQSCSIVLCSVIMVLMTSGNIKGQFDEVYTHLVKFYLHELFEPILYFDPMDYYRLRKRKRC